jgi:hypothetical protein
VTVGVYVAMHTSRGQNTREHHMTRARRWKKEKATVGWALRTVKDRPAPPCKVKLTRIAPGNGLDDDNMSGSMKAIRDAVAEWLGVDDKRTDLVAYSYAQQRGPWGVVIEVTA